ncbi:class I SAM-dependent methyltransferase [Streptosporangium fragile]|uniref:Class I SAM-dependent methyltransferase n=1 Tax=Streptosporangium fragile TaxID=46186 RepID=A0ABN3WCJ6_9ACTN
MPEPDFLAATRSAYDAAATQYAEVMPERFHTSPLSHAMIPVFAELVRASGGGLVADAGCGPGHVTAHLRSLGVTAFGVDLSPRMIALARDAHPELRFEVGPMDALTVEDASLAGVLANYSIIHTPPERLPATLAEFGRVLAPGGHLLLGFHACDDPTGPAEAFDHTVCPAYRYSPGHVAELLLRAGFAEMARLAVAPGEDPRRGLPRAFLLVRRVTPDPHL